MMTVEFPAFAGKWWHVDSIMQSRDLEIGFKEIQYFLRRAVSWWGVQAKYHKQGIFWAMNSSSFGACRRTWVPSMHPITPAALS